MGLVPTAVVSAIWGNVTWLFLHDTTWLVRSYYTSNILLFSLVPVAVELYTLLPSIQALACYWYHDGLPGSN